MCVRVDVQCNYCAGNSTVTAWVSCTCNDQSAGLSQPSVCCQQVHAPMILVQGPQSEVQYPIAASAERLSEAASVYTRQPYVWGVRSALCNGMAQLIMCETCYGPARASGVQPPCIPPMLARHAAWLTIFLQTAAASHECKSLSAYCGGAGLKAPCMHSHPTEQSVTTQMPAGKQLCVPTATSYELP